MIELGHITSQLFTCVLTFIHILKTAIAYRVVGFARVNRTVACRPCCSFVRSQYNSSIGIACGTGARSKDSRFAITFSVEKGHSEG